MTIRIVGRCSLCNGRVTVPTVFHSIYPPVPTCERCGATADADQNLPVIPMAKPSRPRYPTPGSAGDIPSIPEWNGGNTSGKKLLNG